MKLNIYYKISSERKEKEKIENEICKVIYLQYSTYRKCFIK